jgi:hypothetical protein
MKEGNTIGYDDIVAMTQQDEVTNEDVEIDVEDNDPFSKFENWVMGLGEASAIISENPEEQAAAIQNAPTQTESPAQVSDLLARAAKCNIND